MTTTLPRSGRWRANPGADYFSDVVDARNMDLDQPGTIALASKITSLFTSDDDPTFGILLAVAATDNFYYLLTSEGAFRYDPDDGSLVALDQASAPAFSLRGDGVMYQNLFHVSFSTSVEYYNSGPDTWSSAITGLSASYPHPLCNDENLSKIAVGNGSEVRIYDSSYNLDDTLLLPLEHVVESIRWKGNKLYIGTRNIAGGDAKLFLWSGFGSEPESGWSVQADWIYSLVEFLSSMVVLTSKGELLRFNAGGFDSLEGGTFPVHESPWSWSTNSAVFNGIGRCANRGMIADGGILHINIDGRVDLQSRNYPGPFLSTQPSGLWRYDSNLKSLYHTGGYVVTPFDERTIASISSSIFTFATAHGLQTGDPVYASSVSGITGLDAGRLYYTIYVSNVSIYLAYTPADAKAGNHFFAEATVTTQTLSFDSFDSYGSVDNVTPGAVGLFTQKIGPSFFGTQLLFGGSANDASGDAVASLMTFGIGRNIGSFTTSPIPSDQVTDIYQKIIQKIRDLWLDTDEIRIKMRKMRRFGLPSAATSGTGVTWTSPTTFTVNLSEKDFGQAQVGDEVAIISGAGAGYTAHILSINTDADPVYTVTLDEAITPIPSLGGVFSDVTVDNWHKIDNDSFITVADENLGEGFTQSSIEDESSWIQFKVEWRGTRVSLNRFSVISQYMQPLL